MTLNLAMTRFRLHGSLKCRAQRTVAVEWDRMCAGCPVHSHVTQRPPTSRRHGDCPVPRGVRRFHCAAQHDSLRLCRTLVHAESVPAIKWIRIRENRLRPLRRWVRRTAGECGTAVQFRQAVGEARVASRTRYRPAAAVDWTHPAREDIRAAVRESHARRFISSCLHRPRASDCQHISAHASERDA